MKLDVNQLRYLSKDDFRTLQAVELGQRNHEIVPVTLVDSIARLKHGGALRCLKLLLKAKLVHHENTSYDGYRLTYLGYDFLAIKAFVNRGVINSVGRQIGVGKESDIYEVSNEDGEIMALKLHRLGRTSFRAVKSKRDYLKHRNSFSWLYISRLAALKEFAFMKALGQHNFPVPVAIDNNRHAVLMSLVDACPLVQVRELENPGKAYKTCMDILSRLAQKGLVHCDFNEFNLLISEEDEITLIDFPQMVSVSHANAEDLFNRDVECVIRFFKKKIGYIPEHDESLPYIRPDFQKIVNSIQEDISPELQASGFDTQHAKTLEDWSAEAGLDDSSSSGEACDSSEDDSEDDSTLRGSDAQQLDESRHRRNGAAAESSHDKGNPQQGSDEMGRVPEEMEDRLGDSRAAGEVEGSNLRDLSERQASGAPDTSLDSLIDNARSLEDPPAEHSAKEAQSTDDKRLQNGEERNAGSQNQSKVAPDIETAVRDQLLLEKRKAKQAQRMRSAVHSAHKSGDKRTRSRGGVNLEY